MLWTIGQMGQTKCGLFGALSAVISTKTSPWFCINQSFFLHKTKLLRYFKRIYIKNWGMIWGCKELRIRSSCVHNPLSFCWFIFENFSSVSFSTLTIACAPNNQACKWTNVKKLTVTVLINARKSLGAECL